MKTSNEELLPKLANIEKGAQVLQKMIPTVITKVCASGKYVYEGWQAIPATDWEYDRPPSLCFDLVFKPVKEQTNYISDRDGVLFSRDLDSLTAVDFWIVAQRQRSTTNIEVRIIGGLTE